ncbi:MULTISPECIES: fused MFS/spermidine synthase [unclassified Bradyrhizobium]|uniref:fused MFS/spermidine synthase n=1 Tax=unclassified Bradyrhizobium TaxID=2631580 RepID=UPI001FF96975|nr:MULTISPECIES: fused MFS/spermidine synthase [unclassified Bradyrhizobium]MCK1707610.1 fused MFS/spermidine synthase [Bradyrhizobium sp. 143]MCK1725596.1 fused MFS/spermidine synthase [Bradyrhizobium sp. 142]
MNLDDEIELRPTAARAARFAPALYPAALFLSALLLFGIQPMFTKMVLPRIGGAAAVWSVAMVFFQAALLLGYAYAHLLSRTLPVALAALVHLGLLAVAATTLPIGIAHGFETVPQTVPELWLLALFATSIGLPFVALAATAPLLQHWFAASGHQQATNPYLLYAASNLGSFAALMTYPFVVEPLSTLHTQILTWSFGYALLMMLIMAAAVVAARMHKPLSAMTVPARAATPTMADRGMWTALAAIPAGLVVAVTAAISTDLAAAPFLWVLPLSLYLLTFVAIFRERAWVAHERVLSLVPFAVVALIATASAELRPYLSASLAIHLVGFVVLALACHGELYRRRPEPARLTEFYLWTSFGGLIGGVFAGLIAPHVFNGVAEYPILVLAALLAMPGTFAVGAGRFMRQSGPGLLLVALGVSLMWLHVRIPPSYALPIEIGLILVAGAMVLVRRLPALFFGLAVLAFVIGSLEPLFPRIEQRRSFFGVHRVVEDRTGHYRLLLHGTTLHGAERVRNADGSLVTGRPEPTTYYYFGGPIADAIAASRAAQGRLARVAVVGLGTGTLACHRQDDEAWTFFELDPLVVRIARDPTLFRFLSECGPDIPIVLGDARLTLTAAPERFDLIVLDAFSSDAIPVHLLTREAFAGYLSRLTAHGAIVLHISNRHMALWRPAAAVGGAEGLFAYGKGQLPPDTADDELREPAQVVVFARDARDLGDLAAQAGWTRLDPDPRSAWSDDYADILGAILDRKLPR